MKLAANIFMLALATGLAEAVHLADRQRLDRLGNRVGLAGADHDGVCFDPVREPTSQQERDESCPDPRAVAWIRLGKVFRQQALLALRF